MTTLNELNAISPIDGRYRNKTISLAPFFSEEALIRYRVLIEIEYFIALCEIPLPQLKEVNPTLFESLRNIYKNFSTEDALWIKETEKTTNHDVKAEEYFIKENITDETLLAKSEYIHFGLTSQDINNTAIPLSLKEAFDEVYKKLFITLENSLSVKVEAYKNISLLARTHGQPASPTRLGKELYVFVERLQYQYSYFNQIPYSAKFGGATGNFNAHQVAFPTHDWKKFGNHFVNNVLGLQRSQTTTQIEHYDNLAALFHNYARINTILIDLCRDIWSYISMDYFKQKTIKGEIGSSAMPHKVNPIDFENAEGNLGIANALFEHLSAKLPISRLQRDLTDSTVLRNIGTPVAHTILAIKSTEKGLGKLVLNDAKLKEDLDNNWAVVAEAIQTILRRENYPNPYEALKDLTRGKNAIDKKAIHEFISGLKISAALKKELRAITPHNYTGI